MITAGVDILPFSIAGMDGPCEKLKGGGKSIKLSLRFSKTEYLAAKMLIFTPIPPKS